MTHYDMLRSYTEAWSARMARRVTTDERGAASAEQIVLIGAAVVGAGAVGVIIWTKMREGANNIQTPAP